MSTFDRPRSPSSTPRSPMRLRRWLLATLAAASLTLMLATQQNDGLVEAPAVAPVSVVAPVAQAPAPSPVVETAIEVRRNDTLSVLFDRAGIAARELYALLGSRQAAQPLQSIYPGETLIVQRRDDALIRIAYQPDRQRTWIIEPEGEGYVGRWEHRELERRVTTHRVVIRNSLYESALDAGLSENLILQVAEIFGWDIDFALDIRSGDQLAVVHEEFWLDGQHVRDGALLAARFVNDGELHQAFRFDLPDGSHDYYDAAGRSLRKQFLRTPVDFRRISSRFKAERWHPVLGVKRPHRGVDYAAAPGTPVRATGDGKVVLAGNKGGYGKTVIIRHGAETQTLYAHLKGYARGLRAGQKVRQGQVIGYVGSSGVSTGPHLHYEFQVAGTHRNPLTVKLPGAAPLVPAELARFNERLGGLRSQLDQLMAGRRLALTS